MLEFLVGMAAVMVNLINPNLTDSSQVMIWAAMNLLPQILGVILLTGVLSAGISSATTFLSLIGASVANDLFPSKKMNSIKAGRIAMIIVSVVVLVTAIYNPPAIFWIMFLGGAIVASSWMPVAVASIFSKRLTKAGAYCGMLFGFLACFLLRLYASLFHISLPVWLDPSIVGIVFNIVAMISVSAFTQVTEEEKVARRNLFIIPDSEKDSEEIRKTLRYTRRSIWVGIIVMLVLLILWVVPYLRGVTML